MSILKHDKFSSEVAKLRDFITQNNELDLDMRDKLDGIDEKLSSIEQYMTKFNSDILPLKIARSNISNYMDELTKIQYHFDTVARTASMLEVGTLPSHPKEYTEGMIQVKDSIIFLEPHDNWKSQPHTLSLLKDISNRAIKECSEEVAKYLSGENIVINELNPPVAKDENSINGITNDKFEYLRLIIETCLKCGYYDIQDIFIKGRVEYFNNCIHYYMNTSLPDKKQDLSIQEVSYTFKKLFDHLQSEWELLASLFTIEQTKSLIKQLLTEPLEIIYQEYIKAKAVLDKIPTITYEDINNTLNNSLDSLFTYSNVLPLYEDFLSDLLLTDLLDKIKTFISTFEQYIYTLLIKTIDTLDHYVYNRSVYITSDGSVNRITTTAVSLLRSMLTYRPILLVLLKPYEQKEVEINKFLVYDDIVQLYYSKYLLTLRQLLVLSTKSCKNITLCHFYLANNFHYIIENIEHIKICVPEYIQDTYTTLFNNEIDRYYLLTWKKVLDVLNSQPDLIFIKDDKLDNDCREAIKNVFGAFNYKVDAVIGEECVWTVVESDLKSRYMKFAKDLIPVYNEFYTKYANTSFSKNKEKYVIYTPESFETKIDLLFSSTR